MHGRSNRYRLQHWQLAERQDHLKELESLGERLQADAERLCAEIDLADGAASASASTGDPQFVRPLLERRDKLLRSIGEVEAQIAEARTAVAEAQQEMKLVEGGAVPLGLKFDDRMTRRMRRSM